jgi:chromosome segregation ATPase
MLSRFNDWLNVTDKVFLSILLASRERFADLRKDHARIKSQNALLKTGVLDEREKVKTLEAGIEERDRELRRLRADADKLTMLNVSYKARIDKLKTELEDDSKSKAQSGSAWDVLMLSSSGPNPQQQLVAKFKTLKRELTTKTEECEQLHIQVADLKNAHRFSTETLETRMQELKTTIAERDETIVKLERDKTRFDRRLQHELGERDAYFESLQRQLTSIAAERDRRELHLTALNRELGCALTTLDHKFRLLAPFDALRHPRLTALDIAPHVRPRRRAQLEVLFAADERWH